MKSPPNLAMPNLKGKRVLVTGGNSGLGFATVQSLASAGAEVILAARSKSRGEKAIDELRATDSRLNVSLATLDLASLESVNRLAENILSTGHPLDILINNAGIMAVPRRYTTDDGFELQFGTNHLGHFALTARLLPALRRANAPRVVTVSSLVQRYGRINFSNLNSEKRYTPWGAYCQSKLANLIFVKHLQRLSERNGWGILSTGAHPGSCRTNLHSTGPNLGKDKQSSFTARLMTLPNASHDRDQGALSKVFAATDRAVRGGDYFGPSGWLELTGAPSFARGNPKAENQQLAERLWSVSEELTEASYESAH